MVENPLDTTYLVLNIGTDITVMLKVNDKHEVIQKGWMFLLIFFTQLEVYS